jgi:hypothetical protein
MARPLYALSIAFEDPKLKTLIELGGAAWDTRKRQLKEWNEVPQADSETRIYLCKHSKTRDIEDAKFITAEQAETLMSTPIALLIERARRKHKKSSDTALRALKSGHERRR